MWIDILVNMLDIGLKIWFCIFIALLLLWCIWKLLRQIYVKEIIDKIDNIDRHLIAITMNVTRVDRKNYAFKILRYEEMYKALKELNEYLLKSKWWIQDCLMTPKEKKRCKEVFVRCVNIEKELFACYLQEYAEEKKDLEIICSKRYSDWLHSMR